MASTGCLTGRPQRPWNGVVRRLVMVLALLPGLVALLGVGGLKAAPDLPRLTGRVVDNANLLSAASASAIESKLKGLEDKSGIQLVVATIPSLGGDEIEPYANRLFRAWKLGDQKKNNGTLLLIAPKEHKARIEVGYGLEGVLTDALSKLIITNALVPRFKTGDFQGGIEKGVDDIIAVLSTDQSDWTKRPDLQAQPQDDAGISPVMIFIIVIGIIVLVMVFRRRGGGGGAGPIFIPTAGTSWTSNSSSTGGSGGGSSGDSGFSGGGGSSGGGGASGDW